MGELRTIRAAADSLAPAPASPAFATALRRAVSGIEGSVVAAELIPAPFAAALDRRRRGLQPALRPAARPELGAIIASLEGMVARSETGTEALFAVERDLADLAGPPLWALEQAAQEFRRGVIGDGRFRPTIGQVRRRAVELAAPFAAELWAIDRVLAAEARAPPTAEERARALKLARRLELWAAEARAPLTPGPSPERERGAASDEA
jgi:hypothetical protein